MEEQNVRPPDYEYYLSRGRIPAGRLNNPFLDRILLPSNPVEPLPWPLNRSARVVNQYTNGNVPPIIQPLPPPPPTVVNPSPLVRYPRGPLFFLVRLARDNLAARASVSANAPSISNNRPNGLVVAAVPNVGASPAVSQPDNAPDEPQGQLVPRANSLVAPTPLMQVRAQYRNRTFDISPAILPRLRAAGPPPHYLGSPSYQNGDWNLKFQIIISPAGTPLADGVFNFVDIFSDQDLLRVSTEYMYSIFNANQVDMRIPLRFDTRSRMLVVTEALIRGPAVPQPVPGPNNNNGNIPQRQRPAPAPAPAVLPNSGNPNIRPQQPLQQPRPQQQPQQPQQQQPQQPQQPQQQAEPINLSLQRAAVPQEAVFRPAKRPAESELPSANGPLQSRQATAAASTSSLQVSPQAIVRIVARSNQQDEVRVGNEQREQAGTSAELERSKCKRQKTADKPTENPTSQANAIALAATTSQTSFNQADASESESESISESQSNQPSTSSSTPRRYPKRSVKPTNLSILPTLRKNNPIKVAPRAAPVSAGKDAKDKHCWMCHDGKGKLRYCSRCSLAWHTKRACSDKFFEPKLKSMMMIPQLRKHRAESCDAYAEKQAWLKTLSSVLDPTVCIECARKEAGVYYSKHYGNLKDFEETGDRSIMERSAAMFQYAVKSLKLETGWIRDKTTGKQTKGRPFEPFEQINYVKHRDMDKVDLDWMLKKAQTIDAYQCAEDFMFDIRKICHSYMVLQQKLHGFEPGSPKYSHFKEQCTLLIDTARNEMDFINRCDSCYRNHYEINTERVKSDMVMPCENPHALVWTVHRNLWWPAKVYEYREHHYYFTSDKYVNVLPFGEESKVKWTSYKLVRSFSKHPPAQSDEMIERFANYESKKQEMLCVNLRQALSDAKQYYHKYWNEYFTERYPLPENDGPITLEDIYIKVELKPKKKTFDNNFILSAADNAENEDDEAEEVEVAPVRRPVGRSRKSENRNAPTPSRKASTSRVEAVAGPSGVSRCAKSGKQSSNKKKAIRRISRK